MFSRTVAHQPLTVDDLLPVDISDGYQVIYSVITGLCVSIQSGPKDSSVELGSKIVAEANSASQCLGIDKASVGPEGAELDDA